MLDSSASMIAAILALAVLVMSVVWRRHTQWLRADASAERVMRDERIAELDAFHAAEASRLIATYESGLAEVEAAAARADAEAATARTLLAASLGTEVASKRMVAAASARAGLTGVLATNVVFVPAGLDQTRSFMVQIDHVLVTRRGILLIENKYWQGIVFDGVLPSTVLPAFGVLFDETTLTEPFALQIAPSSSTAWDVRQHIGSAPPATQVRRQAARLSEHLADVLGSRPQVETAVLYSHSLARVFAKAVSAGASSNPTKIIVGFEPLTRVLRSVANRTSATLTDLQIETLKEHFTASGAHVESVGPSTTS